MTATFPRSARVRARAEYAAIFDHSRRVSEPVLSLHWQAASTPARLGLAVSRKVDTRAVQRNRIKRILREQFRALRAQLPGGDYVIVARKGAAETPATALREAFVRLLVRAGALPATSVPGTMPSAAPSVHPTRLDFNAGHSPRPRPPAR